MRQNCLQCDWSRVLFKGALWSSPCWYSRAAHHSSYRTYAHHMYISFVSTANNSSPLTSLILVSSMHTHTHAECMCLWVGWGRRAYTLQCVHTHIQISDISVIKKVRHTLMDKYTFKCSSVWRETSVMAATSCNSHIIRMTNAISALVVWKYSTDSGGLMWERSVVILWTESESKAQLCKDMNTGSFWILLWTQENMKC